MMLDVKEVARIFSVSEKTIYRWISKNEIPAYKIGEVYRFNRVELMEWANGKKISVSCEIFDEKSDSPSTMPSLAEAIEAGGIYYRVQGVDKESVIKYIVNIMRLPEDIDREFLAGALIARENLGSTAIGDSVAIPHVRNPNVFHISQPILALCFLDQPIDFGAIDGKPVDTVFTIITHTVRSHLHILSRLSYALQQSNVRRAINSSSSRQEVIDTLTNFEKSLNSKLTT